MLLRNFRIHLIAMLFMSGFSCCIVATTYTVNSTADTNTGSGNTGTLRYVLTQMNSSGTTSTFRPASDNTITLSIASGSTITLGSDLPVIQRGVTINGPAGVNVTINGANTARLFATFKSGLSLSNINLQNGLALGGAGAAGQGGGGGGLGAGGAIYIDPGAVPYSPTNPQTLTLSNVSITNCKAQGGNGGNGASAATPCGGGGGASFTIGAGKTATGQAGGGDNGGSTTGAANSTVYTTAMLVGYGGGRGSSQGSGSYVAGDGGGSGAGLAAIGNSGRDGGNGGYCGGGGGGAGSGGGIGGGGGGDGGGACGSVAADNGGAGGGYGSGASGGRTFPTISAGGGGFGGGGGGFNGGGGFGGGSGGSAGTTAVPGSFGGGGALFSGAVAGGGGGGAIGGAIFVGDQVTLSLLDSIAISANTTKGGVVGSGGIIGSDGSPYANDVFLFKNASLKYIGTSTTFSFAIQGDTTAGATIDAGLNVNGTGILSLTNTSNNYQGSTLLSSGTLSISSDLNLGTVPSVPQSGKINFSGGNLQTEVGAASFAINSNRGIALNANGAISVSSAATILTYGGTLAGAVGNTLTVGGSGKLTLTNSGNTYSGPTNISGGTLSISSDTNLGTAPVSVTPGKLLIGNGGVLETTSSFVLSSNRGITINSGGGVFRPTGTLTYAGVISGSGSLGVNGTGTLLLGATNTSSFTGVVNVTSGTLQANNVTNVIAGSTGLVMSSSAAATFNLGGQNQTVGSLSGGSSATVGNIVLGHSVLTINQTTPGIYGGVISGDGSLILSNTSTNVLTLSNVNTYIGTTTINGGTLSISADNNLGPAPVVATAGQLAFGGGVLNTAIDLTLNINRGIALNSGGGTISPNASTTLTYSGVIAGSNALTKSGAGTFNLIGVNIYTGATNINSGILSINADNNLGAAPVVATVGQLTFGGGVLTTTNSFILNSNRGITLNTAGIISPNASTTLTYGGIIAGGNSLTKSGAGTLALSGVNTYTGGTNVSAGTLQVVGDSVPSTGVVTISGGIFNLTSGTFPNVIFSNQVAGTAIISGVFSPASGSSNAGALNIAGAFTVPAIFTNTGTLYVIGSGNVIGDLTSGVSLTIGQDSLGGINAANFSSSASSTISDIPIINVVAGSFSTNAGSTISGVNTSFTVASGTSASLAGTFTGTGSGVNNGNMGVSSIFGLASLNNNNAILTFTTGANNSTPITNNAGGTFNISGSSTNSAAISNFGSMVISANLVGSALITNENTGQLAIANSVNINNSLLNEAGGIVNVTGNNNIVAVTSHGTMNFTISNVSIYDSLIASGTANLTGSTINVISSATTSGAWTILSGAPLTAPSTIKLPTNISGLFSKWDVQTTGTSIIVKLTSISFLPLAIGPVNQSIATVLDAMASDIINPSQQALINAFYASTTQQQLNDSLRQMMPIANSSAPNLMLQDSIFAKVETRLAAVQNNYMLSATQGIAAGDVSPTTAMWLGGFGSFARQAADREDFGYRARGFGGIIGFDSKMHSEDIFGFGIAFSRSIVHEYSNTKFTSGINGYHALAYGTKFLTCNKFLEWLITGALTDTNNNRMINVSNVIMSTSAQYYGGQGAFRLNYGVNFDLGSMFRISPVSMLQYAFVYQPDYDEQPSLAALHVSPTNYQNVLTIGGGARLSFPCDDWWLIGTRELRVLLTYDVITAKNNTASNFLIGSNDFIITNPAADPLALNAGVDFSFALFKRIQMQFSYDYELRHKYTDHSGAIKLKYLF